MSERQGMILENPDQCQSDYRVLGRLLLAAKCGLLRSTSREIGLAVGLGDFPAALLRETVWSKENV